MVGKRWAAAGWTRLQSAIASSNAILGIIFAVFSHRARRVSMCGNGREMEDSNSRPLSRENVFAMDCAEYYAESTCENELASMNYLLPV